MSDVLLIDNSILQETVLVPVTAVQPDLVTQTDVVVYVPLASKNAHGIVKIGEGLHITSDGLLSFDRSEVTIKELALNGTLLVPDENKRVNIVLHKTDVGLGNVDNTSDLDKPISTAVQNALDLLNTDLTDDILDVDDRLIAHITDFDNPHRVTKHQVGLGNVDNTSDADKPISRATQRELSRIQGLIKGGENAVSYESYEAMVNDFNVLGPDVYNVGQSVFIATLKVPDLWVYGVEEEFEEFTYIDDSTIESILNIDGTFKVGYYRLAALDTLKVDLSDYVTTEDLTLQLESYVTNQSLDLRLENVAYQDDLPNEYVKDATVLNNTLTIIKKDNSTLEFGGGPSKYIESATSSDGTLTLKDQDGNDIVFESPSPDLSAYLPRSAGEANPVTGLLFLNEGLKTNEMIIKDLGEFDLSEDESFNDITFFDNLTDPGIYTLRVKSGSGFATSVDCYLIYVFEDTYGTRQRVLSFDYFGAPILHYGSRSKTFGSWGTWDFKTLANTSQITSVDTELSVTSENPVQNKVITEALAKNIQYLGNFTGVPVNGVVSDSGVNLDTLTTPGVYYFKNTVSLGGTTEVFYILFVSYHALSGERAQTYFSTLTNMQSRTTTGNSFEGISFNTTLISPDYYVKKTEQSTIVAASNTPLYLQSNTTFSLIGFKNSSGTTVGWLGANADKKPIFNDSLRNNILAYASDVPKLGTTNWSVSQNSSGELVFTYTA